MPRSTASFRIRAATAADGERVAAMCAALSAEEATGRVSGFTAEIFRRDGFGPQPAFACMIAEQEGQALGYALYHDDYDTDRLCRSVYLADLYVETAARGRGVGQALAAAVAQAGQQCDARVMMWSVLKTNLAARRFYAGIGEEIDDQVETLAAGSQFESLAAAPADGVTVRTATAADCPMLARFLGNMLAEIGLEQALEAAARFSADGFGTRPAFTAVIAEHAGVPAGYALFWPTYDTESATRGGWLSDLYMLPQARRQGIARRLMVEVAARTAAQGGRYLTWLVHTENTRARAFYRTLATEWPDGIPCICAGARFLELAQSASAGTGD
jgi:ribosomal protein S18 acetylase RimI-like enzyme